MPRLRWIKKENTMKAMSNFFCFLSLTVALATPIWAQLGNLTDDSPAGALIRQQETPVIKFQVKAIPTRNGNILNKLEKLYMGFNSSRMKTGSVVLVLRNFNTRVEYSRRTMHPP